MLRMKYLISMYLPWKYFEKKSDYTNQDIENFQDLIDDFFSKYIAEVGIEGITNYIYMLKNLYKYSQQGWESLNAKYKQVFFNHTQQGGHFSEVTEGESERSYIESVMKAFQRELLWISGDAEHDFTTKE
jgi:hypothetical protein